MYHHSINYHSSKNSFKLYACIKSSINVSKVLLMQSSVNNKIYPIFMNALNLSTNVLDIWICSINKYIKNSMDVLSVLWMY